MMQIKDFDRLFLRRLEQSPYGGQFRASHHEIKKLFRNPNRIKNKIGFQDLVAINENGQKYKLFDFYKRCISSESHLEGMRNQHISKILVSLPYSCIKHNRRKQILKQWRRIFFAIKAILRYKYVIQEHYFIALHSLPKRRKNTGNLTPTKNASPTKRSKSIRYKNTDRSSTFGLLAELAMKQRDSVKSTSRISPFQENRRSIYYKDFAMQDRRIERLMKGRAISLVEMKEGAKPQTLLQPLETKRTTSIQIRNIRLLKR